MTSTREQIQLLKDTLGEGIFTERQAELITDALDEMLAVLRLETWLIENAPDDMEVPIDSPVADVALAILKMVREGQKAMLELTRLKAEGKLYEEAGHIRPETMDDLAVRKLADSDHSLDAVKYATASGVPFVASVDLAQGPDNKIILGTLVSEMSDEYIDNEIAELVRERFILSDLLDGRITQEQHDGQSKYKTLDTSLLTEAIRELKAERFNREQRKSAQVREASLGGPTMSLKDIVPGRSHKDQNI